MTLEERYAGDEDMDDESFVPLESVEDAADDSAHEPSDAEKPLPYDPNDTVDGMPFTD